MNERYFCKNPACQGLEHGTGLMDITITPPPGMYTKENFSVEACMAEEIAYLWRNGVKTGGCCCGHGKVPATIGILPGSINLAISMGYERSQEPGHHEHIFYAKGGFQVHWTPELIEKLNLKGGR